GSGFESRGVYNKRTTALVAVFLLLQTFVETHPGVLDCPGQTGGLAGMRQSGHRVPGGGVQIKTTGLNGRSSLFPDSHGAAPAAPFSPAESTVFSRYKGKWPSSPVKCPPVKLRTVDSRRAQGKEMPLTDDSR